MDQPWGRIEHSLDMGRSDALVDGSLPLVREMEEEIWGVLTVVSGGWHRDRARPVMSFNGDDDFLSTRRQCGSHVLAERAPREGGRLHEAHRGLHRPVEWWRQAVSEEE
jgi:hypothetical protein